MDSNYSSDLVSVPLPEQIIMKLFLDRIRKNTKTNNLSTAATKDIDNFGDDVDKYVSDDVTFYVIVIVQIFMCGVISIFGIGTNTINIIVFVKQGVFTENNNSNVSLFGLAVSDLFNVITMLWLSVSYSIAMAKPPNLPWDPYHMMYITGGWPHVISGLITRMVTAFVSFERCFCVVFPFKVKSVFTSRCSLTSIVCIFGYFLISYSPVFILNRFRHIEDLETNTTRFVLESSSEWEPTRAILQMINLFTLNFGSVAIVLICSTITVSHVKLSSSWRESISAVDYSNRGTIKKKDKIETPAAGVSSKTAENETKFGKPKTPENETKFGEAKTPENETKFGEAKTLENETKFGEAKTSENETKFGEAIIFNTEKKPTQTRNKSKKKSKLQKEKKLIRMISLISWIFLVCYLPNISFPIMSSYNSEMIVNGKYSNLAWLMFSISFLLDTINSSINMAVYYRMSSQYKKQLDGLLGLGTQQ